LNEKRLAVVKNAWQFLDKAGARRLHIGELLKVYNAQSHPRVLCREKKQETVYNDFESCLGARS